MAKTLILNQATYPIGTTPVGPANLPTGVTSIELTLDGAQMHDPALHVEIKMDISLDNGATWNNPPASCVPFPCAMTLDGGARDRSGNFLAEYMLGTDGIPQPSNSQRKMRAFLIISGTPLTTSGSISLN